MKKPIIGVVPLVDKLKDSFWMLPGYMNGLHEAGALPIMLPLISDDDKLDRLMELCDGILLTGGQDVSPKLYGEDVNPECGDCCNERDEMEIKIINKALDKDYPLFGICRGIQILNVALGGTLYQDIPTQLPSKINHQMKSPYDSICHEVAIFKDTPLHKLIQHDKIGVNSYHHQGVKALSPKLKAMAEATDGLIEAVYVPNKKFIWAVQWHPEFSHQNDKFSQILFKKFVSICGVSNSQ